MGDCATVAAWAREQNRGVPPWDSLNTTPIRHGSRRAADTA